MGRVERGSFSRHEAASRRKAKQVAEEALRVIPMDSAGIEAALQTEPCLERSAKVDLSAGNVVRYPESLLSSRSATVTRRIGIRVPQRWGSKSVSCMARGSQKVA